MRNLKPEEEKLIKDIRNRFRLKKKLEQLRVEY